MVPSILFREVTVAGGRRVQVPTDLALLEDIRGHISCVVEHCNRENSKLWDSHLVQGTEIRNLQAIAEPTRRLKHSLRAIEPAVSWRAITGFFNAGCLTSERSTSSVLRSIHLPTHKKS